MKAIVTGGAGFIGSHLVESLLNEGHDVTVIDNYSTGRPQNLDHVIHHRRLSLVQSDICDLPAMKSTFEGAEWVFHLAALADIVPSIQRPREYHRANVEGTLNVVECARDAKVQRLIYAASSSCYGIPDIFPTPETAPIRPQYPYALTKYLGEQIVMHWAKIYDLPAVSLRFFNVYGPRSRTSGTYGAVFGVFLAQKLAGQPFTVVGDGTQTRDFTYVTDVVQALISAANSHANGAIYNVGSGNTYSVNRLVELLEGDRIYIPKRPGEPDCTFADTAKISEELHWKPQVSFEDGIRLMMRNIEYWRNAPVWNPNTIATATKEWFKYLS